jgi:nucleotide-binding universal stress UspA family protein
MSDAAGRGAIVVGVDGSDESRTALHYALDEGVHRSLPVHAVTAWTPPELWVTTHGVIRSAAEMQAAAREETTRFVDAVTAERAEQGTATPEVSIEVYDGPPAAVLERLSATASLLVIGHRGRGAIATRMIGSVGLSCVVHARCSVVVVRG